MDSKQMDAYRYFFPAGWLFGLWGVLLWILFPWNLVAYPGLHHPEIMTGGFFLCFVCGFLMTAAPKFTSTFGSTKVDQIVSYSLIMALFVSLFFQSKVYFYIAVDLTFVFLIYFMMRRFLKRRTNPPDSFIFVGLGLLVGLSGAFILTIAEFYDVPEQIFLLARLFFLQAYILCLVLGVGSRLVPALLGWGHLPTEHLPSQNVKKFVLFGALFVSSYVVESLGGVWMAHFIRAITISGIFFMFWSLHRLPKRRAVQSWWLWASAWFVLLGQWGIVVWIDYRVHMLHLILVSGLGLMTLMIATRVTLSHGKHDMNIEQSSKMLCLGALLLCFAGLTRLSAGFAPHIYQSHLIYAAYTWILGLLVWGGMFLPKLFRIRGS